MDISVGGAPPGAGGCPALGPPGPPRRSIISFASRPRGSCPCIMPWSN